MKPHGIRLSTFASFSTSIFSCLGERHFNRRGRSGFTTLLMVFLLSMSARAQQEQSGHVTYVTSTTAYVDLGSNNGFEVGDSVRVMSKGVPKAILIITNIASKSMSARIAEMKEKIREGDEVRGISRHSVPLQRAAVATDSLSRPMPVSVPRPSMAAGAAPSTVPESTTAHGRVSLQYYGLTSSNTSGFDFSQPALSLNLTAEHILGMPLQFAMYSNHRYDARSGDRRTGIAASPWSNRVYQFSFLYGRPDGSLTTTVGRFIAPLVGGVGTFDGVMLASRSGPWEVGFVGGGQPGYVQSEVNFDDPKLAAYVGYTSGSYESIRYQGSAAFAQTYKSGAVDRGFMYVQNILSIGSDISFYQNANLDLYDITRDGSSRKLHLSDFYLSSTYRPLRWLTTGTSYSVRRNVYYLRSFGNISDSLFDKSAQHNVQFSVGINLPMAVFLSGSGSLRLKQGDSRSAKSVLFRVNWSNALQSEMNVLLSGSVSDNLYNTSRSFGLELSRDLFQELYLSLHANRYEYSFSDRLLQRSSGTVEAYYRMTKSVFISINYELAWEGAIRSNRMYSDVSFRF